MSQFFASGGQSIGVSASASVLLTNIQDWFPLGLTGLGLTGLISLQSKGLSRVFSKPQLNSINSLAFSLLYGPNLTSIQDYWKNHSFNYTDLHQKSNVSAFLICCLGLLWLSSKEQVSFNFMTSVTICMILEPKKIKAVTVSIVPPSIYHKVQRPAAMIFIIWMLSFKPAFSLSSLSRIDRLFRPSSLSAIRVVSSACLRFLIFLLTILIPAYDSSSPAFPMMHSACKLNKQGDNI